MWILETTERESERERVTLSEAHEATVKRGKFGGRAGKVGSEQLSLSAANLELDY